MTYQFVQIHRNGPGLTVVLHRPERLNALHAPAHLELAQVFDDFERDPALRVAVIRGTGRAFCAGNDLKWQAQGGSMDRPSSGFAGLTLRHNRAKPVIAEVNGLAYGGGCEIVLASDLAVGAESARFGLTEVRYGLVPLAGVHLLPRRVALKDAMFMLLTGRVILSTEALRMGLINEVVSDAQVTERAQAYAQWIVEASPQAIAACMELVRQGLRFQDVSEAMTARAPALEKMRAGEDFAEGPRAFAEGRKPKWSSP